MDWTGIAASLAALAAVIAAITALLQASRTRTIAANVLETKHTINSRTDELLARVDQLSGAIRDTGNVVPPVPSK